MTNESPTKVSPDGPYHSASLEEKMHILTHIIRRFIRQPRKALTMFNVANSATKALQAAFKWQWLRSPDTTDTLLVSATTRRKIVDGSAHQFKDGMNYCRQIWRSVITKTIGLASVVLLQLRGLRCSRLYIRLRDCWFRNKTNSDSKYSP